MDQEISDEVRAEVRKRIASKQAFTAWNISLYMWKWGVREGHEDLKAVVHEMYEQGNMQGYSRELRDMGGPIPAWYYYHRSDYASQQYATPTTNQGDQTARNMSLGVTSGYGGTVLSANPRTVPIAQLRTQVQPDPLTAKPDKRGTVCVPASAIRAVEWEPGDVVAVVPVSSDRCIQLLRAKDLVAVPTTRPHVYTVDKDYNIRVTGCVIDEAWAWADVFTVEILAPSATSRGELVLKPQARVY